MLRSFIVICTINAPKSDAATSITAHVLKYRQGKSKSKVQSKPTNDAPKKAPAVASECALKIGGVSSRHRMR